MKAGKAVRAFLDALDELEMTQAEALEAMRRYAENAPR